MSIAEAFLHQCFYIIDLANCGDGKISQMGAHQKRLGLVVRNTADSQIAFHLCHILVKLGTKRRILNIMDHAVKSARFSIYCHSTSSCSQMGVIINSKKQIHYTIRL